MTEPWLNPMNVFSKRCFSVSVNVVRIAVGCFRISSLGRASVARPHAAFCQRNAANLLSRCNRSAWHFPGD